MIPGIDISHWQVEIDWNEVKRAGVKFAFIKATEFPDKKTSLYIDERLYENLKGASEAGIYWGPYHFFRTHIDPVIQAQAFVETVGQFTSLPPVLDLEVAGCKGERLNHKVKLFLEEVKRLTRRTPIIYTSGGFWRPYMTYEKRTHADWAREYPLWMAKYTTLWPNPIYPWAGWDFWQYSDSGKLPGIKTHVDLNWFNGSEQELVDRFTQDGASYVPTTTGTVSAVSTEADEKMLAFEMAKQVDMNYRGDYQEAEQGSKRYYANGRRPRRHSINTDRPGAHIRPTLEEVQWVRSYFVDKALRN